MSSLRLHEQGRGQPRHGFTLVELLAAITLFMVMAVAITGIFFAATTVYRDGEAARQANDEALAALAAIDDDLRHVVPAADGGFIYVGPDSPHGTVDAAGSQVLAFVIRNPDPLDLGERGERSELLVAYWADNSTGNLVRLAMPADRTRPTSTNPAPNLATLRSAWGQTNPPVLARGCLLLRADVAEPGDPRDNLDWSGSHLVDGTFCTEPTTGDDRGQPMPAAVRISLIMTGVLDQDQQVTGRAFVVRDQGANGILVGGATRIPTGGAMVRIGEPSQAIQGSGWAAPEWIRVDRSANNLLTWDPNLAEQGRGLFGTVQGTHQQGEPVRWGTGFAVVRRF